MEFRVTGGFNRLYLPQSSSQVEDDESPEATAEQIQARAGRIAAPSLRKSIQKRDPEFSSALGSALTLFGVAEQPTAKRIFSESSYLEVKEEIPNDAPSRDDLENLRGAVARVAQEFLRDQPTAAIEDLEAELDNVFGDGFSNLAQVRRVDNFNGTSEIRIEDFDYSELVESEQEIVKAAVETSNANFKFSPSGRESDQEELKFEEVSFQYESGRYSLAYSPDDIAESSALTDSSDFLTAVSRR